MKYNTKNIIGRETEIRDILQTLEDHSIILSSHRRMGKTFLLKKLTNSTPNDTNFVLMIEEGTKTPEEFVYNLYKTLQEANLITVEESKKIFEIIGKALDATSIKDIKLPSFRKHWKETLRNIIEQLLVEQANKNTIIMIDEFPIMLYKFIVEHKLTNEAIELIDTLREIRQKHGERGIKFIYCGSIGINVVLEKLKDLHNYAGEPINDMRIEILDAMSMNDAKELVRHIAATKDISITPNDDKTIEALCNSVDCLPFYIDLLIKEICLRHETISQESVKKETDALVETASNQGQFNHYTQRISTYYKDDIAQISKRILNWLSTKESYTNEDDIINALLQKEAISNEKIKMVLKKLFEDLYLERKIQDGKRKYRFKYQLIKKWWMINFG